MIEVAPDFLLKALEWINKTKPTLDYVTLLISNTQFSSKTTNGNMFVAVNMINNIIQLCNPAKIQSTLILDEDNTQHLAIYYLMYGFTYFYGEDKLSLTTEQRASLATKWCYEFYEEGLNKAND